MTTTAPAFTNPSPLLPPSANDNSTGATALTPLLEQDLEGVIVTAASGDEVAKQLLRTVVYRIALDSLVQVEAAEQVTRTVLWLLGHPYRGPGRPIPGHAVAWLEKVTRTYARYHHRRTSRARWAEWDPPGGMDGP